MSHQRRNIQQTITTYQRNAQRTGDIPMLDGVRLYIKSIVIVAIGLSSMLSFASSAAMKSQDGAANKVVSAAQQSLEGQSQTLLPDGRLLLVGGQESRAAVKTVFFQNAQTGARTEASGELLHARAFHSATLLPSGSVLISGGVGDGNSALAQAELFDPSKQTFVDYPTTCLTPRAYHTATLLTDGRVLIAGGLDGQGNTLSQIQVWDYRTSQSTTLAVALTTPRSGHTATLLPDGTVLLWGGQDANGNPLDNGEIIDPSGPSVRPVSSAVELSQDAPRLAASIPQSGETGIQLDQLIALRFSEPLNVTSLHTDTITLRTSQGNVAMQVVPAEGGILAFITPLESLQNGTEYILTISGATDNVSQILPDTTIIFTTVASTDSGSALGNDSSTSSSSTGLGSSGAAGVGTTAPSGLTSEWRKLPILKADKGVTALAGQVLTLDGYPLPDVLIEIDSRKATTDKTGRFVVQNTGSGHHMMIVDGSTANSKSNSYGLYRIGVELKAGVTNSLNYTVWMTALDTEHAVNISSPTTAEVIVTNPNVPGLELHIPAGTVIHDARGNVVTQIGITPVPMNQPPFPLKLGVQFPVYFTIQPGGATFMNTGNTWSPAITNRAKGATIYYKNYLNAKPGARYSFWNYDPTQKGWYVYGHGRVSSNAKSIAPEDGTQITSFDGAMVSQPGNGPGTGPGQPPWWCFWCSTGGDPVNLQTGLFVYTKTDLALNDVIPLSLTRTYRQGDYLSRAFGIGTNMNYNIFMVGDDLTMPEGYTYQDLILADGGRIHFTRTSPCDSNGYCNYTNAIFTATSTPGDFYGATIAWIGSNWTLTKKDGTVYQFPDSSNSYDPQQAAPLGMHDRYGNALTFTRDSYGNLLKVTSPNGRWIQFTYDSSNRITGAQDNIGRTTSYTYNAAGYLATATDVNGSVTTYTYDADGDMLTLTDPNGVVYLQNVYSVSNFPSFPSSSSSVVSKNSSTTMATPMATTSGPPMPPVVPMVIMQTQADGSTYQFAYTLNANGSVAQTNVTDPRGYLRTVTYNSDGFPTSNTFAVGMPEQQTITFSVQQGTGFLLSSTDALNRTTAYSYDSMADVTSVTRLYGTSNAATTTMAYDPPFYELSTTTDPIGNTTNLAYDNSGNMIVATDPLGNTASFTYNAAGQPTTVTDSLGNQTQLTYSNGDLVSTTDPSGRTVSRFVDGAGRVAAVTDPLGHTSRTVYNPLNEIIASIDPLGNQIAFTYDGDGNLLTVTDANQHSTKYVYNNLDQMVTRTNPLGNSSSALYDLNGNLSQFADRKSQVTTYTYDGLNRATNVKFADGSTITNTYDAGNRLTRVTDSITGTIARSYDGLNSLLSETTPQGSVAYTYDGDERRQTMSVSGQVPVNYSFDNASRLTSIIQGASTVSFTYDSDSRRTSLTLPNGISTTYSYDAASQLTGIVYQGGALGTQNLTYSYDLAGRRIGVGGTLASTQLPTAVSSAAYNANNQLTSWGTTAMTYDLNGNTLNDGMNSYVWDARNRLLSANNNGAAFSYDPLGRRVSKTILSTSTNYLYDDANAVQEFGTLPTANLLTGGVDERFTRTTSTETDDYLIDALGSTVELTGATGTTEEQYSYSPFGSQSATGATTTNSYNYTGRETDGLGINYYRARYYNPNTGRFLSEDPLGFMAGINFYAYAGNNPVSFRDSFGQYTTQSGLSGSVTYNGFGVYGSIGLAADNQGNLGWYWSWGGGAGVGLGLSGSLGIGGAISNAQNISDLAGPFGNASVVLGDGLGGTADVFFGPSPDGGVVGIGGTGGIAGGASASTSVTDTYMHPFWNPFNPGGPGGGGGNGGGGGGNGNGSGGNGSGGNGSGSNGRGGNGGGCSMSAKKC
jgi:RHS repeat-associated protein